MRFFIESGFDIRGVEINKEMIQLGKENLTRLGYEVPETREGNNLSIPYDDNFFDMFVCINTIHYVFGLDIYKALEEYKRVVKDGGVVVVETPAEKHFAKESATRCDEFSWKWEAEGFRKGQTFGFFDSKDHFRQTLKKHFSEVEIHRRTEETELTSLDFYIGVCKV